MVIKIILVILFFLLMVGVGLYSRKQARSVDGFVLGGRQVGPWLTAFAFGTSYFSAVIFVGYAGQVGWDVVGVDDVDFDVQVPRFASFQERMDEVEAELVAVFVDAGVQLVYV